MFALIQLWTMELETEKANISASNNKRVSFKPHILIINSDPRSGSRPDSETNLKEIGHGSAETLDSSDTEISFSSQDGSTKLLCREGKADVSNEALYGSEKSINEHPESTLRCSDITHEPLVPHISPTHSPPIQVMERPGGFDPKRIPDSIFSGRLTTTEWSTASNDSLFSIGTGNSSFSGDNAIEEGVDLYKKGELPKSGECCQYEEPFRSEESPKFGEPSWELYQSREKFKDSDLKCSSESLKIRQTAPTSGVEPKESLGVTKDISEDMKPGETGTPYHPLNDVPKALMNNQVDTNIGLSNDSSRATLHSDKRETRSTFAPSKKKVSSCPWCHCPDLRQALCCCERSACSCKFFTWLSCPRHFWSSKNCFCMCSSWPSRMSRCSNCAWPCHDCWHH